MSRLARQVSGGMSADWLHNRLYTAADLPRHSHSAYRAGTSGDGHKKFVYSQVDSRVVLPAS